MPFMTKSEVMTLTVDKGWVTEASVEDVKLLPGVHRTMFRLPGGDWVAREIMSDVNAGRAEFVVLLPDRWWRGFWLGWVWVTPLIAMIGCVYLTIPWFRQ